MERTTTRTAVARVGLLAALLAVGVATAGCGIGDRAGRDPGTPGTEATGTPTGPAGPGTAGDNSTGPGGTGPGGGGGDGGPGGGSGEGGGTSPSPSPAGGGTPQPPGGTADLERVLLLPVALVAPTTCFTEGLDTRYVDGYGAQAIDPRPHGGVVGTRVEHEGLSRLRMDQANRRVNLLPGSGRAVEAVAGEWTVSVEVHMFLSGGFQLSYTRTHQAGETGQFRRTFTSPVDGTCTVELLYAITTSAA